MHDFERLLRNVNDLDINDVFKQIWSDSKVQRFIIALNTEGETTSQLFNLGVDSDGQLLTPAYTFNTIQFKVEKGQRFDHVTLKDTGGFYESFVVIPLPTGFRLTANPIVDDGSNLFEKYGEKVVGLTESNQELLGAFIEEDFTKELEKRLFQ